MEMTKKEQLAQSLAALVANGATIGKGLSFFEGSIPTSGVAYIESDTYPEVTTTEVDGTNRIGFRYATTGVVSQVSKSLLTGKHFALESGEHTLDKMACRTSGLNSTMYKTETIITNGKATVVMIPVKRLKLTFKPVEQDIYLPDAKDAWKKGSRKMSCTQKREKGTYALVDISVDEA
jgi:hypothetical protein